MIAQRLMLYLFLLSCASIFLSAFYFLYQAVPAAINHLNIDSYGYDAIAPITSIDGSCRYRIACEPILIMLTVFALVVLCRWLKDQSCNTPIGERSIL